MNTKRDNMKTWHFVVNNNIDEISTKLESGFGSIKAFVFSINRENHNAVRFKLRKRILYAWYMSFQNWTTVNGKLLNTESTDKTNIEVSFSQHFLIKAIIYTHFLLGLGLIIAITLGINSSPPMYILGGILLVLGIAFWIVIQKKFLKDIEKYKLLISEMLES